MIGLEGKILCGSKSKLNDFKLIKLESSYFRASCAIIWLYLCWSGIFSCGCFVDPEFLPVGPTIFLVDIFWITKYFLVGLKFYFVGILWHGPFSFGYFMSPKILVVISCVQIFFSWVFYRPKIFCCGYFAGSKSFSCRHFVSNLWIY